MLEHVRVLQEESERICGKHLPEEIVLTILFRWGGLATPTATIIRDLMAKTYRCELPGQTYRFVPRGIVQDLGELITEEQLVNPSAAFVSHVTSVGVVRQCDVTGRFHPPSPYSTRATRTAEGSVFVQPMLPGILFLDTDPHYIWKWQGLDVFHQPFGAGMRMRSAYLWIMAARARGVPDYIVNLCYRARDCPNANKSELYQLVLRAETDHTWRFWHDLFFAYRDFCIPATLGHVSGAALTATVMALGAQYF